MNAPSNHPENSISDTEVLVNAFLENCRVRSLSKESLRYYSGFLSKLAVQYPELPDTPEPLQEFIFNYLSSDARRHAAYRAIRTFYNWAEKRYGVSNAMNMVGAPRVHPTERPALTIDQLRQLLDYPHHSPLIRTLLYFLADTGCRIGEAANLHADEIYPDTVNVTGKTGSRIIPISQEVRDMLLKLGPGKLFPGLSHWLSEQVVKAGKAAGIRVRAHDLRRTFATNWRGSDLSLKYIGGWASWRMVEHYSQRRLDKAQDDHHQFSPVALIRNGSGDNATHDNRHNADSLQLVAKLAEELGTVKQKLRDHKEPGDEFGDCIANMPGLKGNLVIAMAKLCFHAALYKFAEKFANENISALKGGSVWAKIFEGCLPLIYDKGIYGADIPVAFLKGESGDAVKFMEQMVANMSIMARSFEDEQLSKALLYRGLMGVNVDLDIFDFSDDEGE